MTLQRVRSTKLINLHITRQTYDFDCGAKALQTVMAYYGVDIREDKLLQLLETNDNGTRVSKIISIAETFGFHVEANEYLPLEKIKEYIKNGNPIIVLLQAWAERYKTLNNLKEDYDDGHYAIIIVYTNKILVFEDPSTFRRTWLREKEFLARWHDIDPEDNKKYEQFGMVLLGKEPSKQMLEHMG